MRTRLLTMAAVVGVVATMLPGHAATAPTAPKPQITDPAGDANGINDQGAGAATVNASGPVDDANADITSVLFATKYKTVTTTKTVVKIVKKKKVVTTVTVVTQVPDGFTVTMNLSAAPDGNHTYDVNATHPICSGSLDFTYSTGPTGLNEVDCTDVSDPSNITTTKLAGEAAVVGNSVVWTIPAAAFPVGSLFSDLTAQTGTPLALAAVDQAGDGSASYKVGS
ncbi:MAG: hypothetical protein JO079_11450 [Frankiaceae bacterium]|nr:hypothetical protein [Frankiaceae bacterium]MBV9369102.1 hypothetical protein [Frankiales bacterium]